MAHGSKPETVNRARELRRDQTPIEAQLWKRLRAGQIYGLKFRRQHPIGRFIADFCCEEARLIIEIDGDSHAEQQEYDETRSAYLSGLGYQVLRFTNRDVLSNMNGVLEVILRVCEERRG